MKKFLLAVLLFGVNSFAVQAIAETTEERIAASLKKIDERIQVKSISNSPVAGLSEVVLSSGEVVYSDSNGEYFLIGQVFRYTDEQGFVNLTEEKEKGQRKQQLATIPEDHMVVFAPEGETKATITVFTDVDCPYCRKLHDEVPQLNAMGIKVNYVAYPLKGEKAYNTMVSIWCAGEPDDKRAALTDAKNGKAIEAKTCDNPVLAQLALGKNMGVSGTPALILEDGTLLPGYLPAESLAKKLGL